MIIGCAKTDPTRTSSPTTIDWTHAMVSDVKAKVVQRDRIYQALLQSGEGEGLRQQCDGRGSVIDRLSRHPR